MAQMENAKVRRRQASELACTLSWAVIDLIDLVVENGCTGAALTSLQGARVEGLGLEVVRQTGLPCPVEAIFSAGFETGDTSVWSSTVGWEKETY